MDIYKKVFLSVFVSVVIFIIGFASRDFIIKKNTSTPPTDSKIKNILLPEPKDGKYKVIGVIDGDTVTLETGEKFRYIGIDAPEANERWGPEAKEFNKTFVLNKKVRVELDRTKLDKFGRILGYVWVDTILVNEAMIERGYAKMSLMKGEAKLKYFDRLQKAEDWARQNHDGLWFDEWVAPSR